LEEHQKNCEKAAKFVEAETVKQRVSQLKKIEIDINILEKKKIHEIQVIRFYC